MHVTLAADVMPPPLSSGRLVPIRRQIGSIARRALSSSQPSPPPPRHYDVLVVGGGATGAALVRALALARGGRGGPSSVGVLDLRDVPPPLADYSGAGGSGGNLGPTPNARAYALSPVSLDLLNGGASGPGPVDRLRSAGRLAAYGTVQVWESAGPATLRFAAEDLYGADGASCGDGDAEGGSLLGAVAEDGPLVSALWDDILGRQGGDVGGGRMRVDFIGGATLRSIVAPPERPTDGAVPPAPVQVAYRSAAADGAPTDGTVTASLLVGADGANSSVRRLLGMPTSGFGYGRRAVTFTVAVGGERGGMAGTAYQRMMPDGPLALLPVWGREGRGAGATEYANIVWSTTPSEAGRLKGLAPGELVREVNDVLQAGPVGSPPLLPPELLNDCGDRGGILPGPMAGVARAVDSLVRGANDGLAMSRWSEDPGTHAFRVPPLATTIVGPVLAFDLSLSQAARYSGPRVALVGDAAHTIHPMAGQGLNLGLGDVKCLAERMGEAYSTGMDPGGTMHFLGRYEAERRAEAAAVLGGVHALHTAFGWRGAGNPAVLARSLGMNLVGAIGPLRRVLAEMATGRRGVVAGLF